MEEETSRYSKRLRTGTRRRYQDDGISDDEIEGKRSFDLDEKLQSDRYNSDLVKIMDGKDFTLEYIQREGLRDPIIFKKADGLGLKMPDPDFSVSDVKLFVGSRRMVDVMDVNTQKGIEMSMGQWRRYYETPASEREKLYNVISLEFSHTKLEHLVKRPTSVDMIDWVDNMWPRHLKERQRDSTNAIIDMQYPKVLSDECRGMLHRFPHRLRRHISLVFWLIPPTPQNLELYENWVLSGKQGDIFLGDKATMCQRIELKQGYTFMIPSGWIHAVYTPMDTLVFGGNFLHSFNIPMQLNIYNIEDRTRVPAKFRYPFYFEMCWYVLERYLYCLTNVSHLTPEFQKHSLGIGLKKEDVIKQGGLNDHAGKVEKEEEEEEEEMMVKEEPEEEAASPTRPGVKVHLTPFELEGLWALLHKLEELPAHKKCPSWYQPPPPLSLLYRPRAPGSAPILPPVPRPVKPSSSISALRRRRVRCKRCEACLRKECGDCNYCRDMRKFGGPGRLKKSCPALPLTAVCAICKEGYQDSEDLESVQTLMECSECAQISSSSSEEETDSSVSNGSRLSGPPAKRAYREGIGIKLERNKILQSRICNPALAILTRALSLCRSAVLSFSLFLSVSQTRSSVSLSPKLLRQRSLERGGVVRAGPGRSISRGRGTSSCRGRGVRLRGGGRGGGLRERMETEGEREDSVEEEQEERKENGQYNGKENRPQRRGVKASEDENGESHRNGESEGSSEGGEPTPSDTSVVLNDDVRGQGSCVTVTLQPSRGRRDPSAIVPKLEANLSSRSLPQNHKALLRPPLRNGAPRTDGAHSPADRLHVNKSHALSSSSPHTLTRSASKHSHMVRSLRSNFKDSPHRLTRERIGKKTRLERAKSSDSRPSSTLRPSAEQNGGSEPGWEREVWVSVFRYLTRAELCVCMAVCKSCLSRCRSISPQALTGIIKRQPVTLDLSWANISKKQLGWLINRLPGLKDLVLSGCNWASVSALSSPSCPLLRSLDLSWADGMKNMQCLWLCGLEVTEATLRLIIRHMPLLTRLELSHCPITDGALNLLSAVGSSTRNTLTHLNLAGCSRLTDRCLVYLRRLSCLSVLDLRGCKGVSRQACESFISELSVTALYCLSDDKLIQRIS
ncbi:Lysine-specific demethylase 2A [Labeo rohita]|uniref:Lysine-specific demethylase 2A n=1 Tax=Labeo rohita TaxID=84645 RepID=A0ABQ8M2R0_LABRO|nr:Lysine-specific demethylase 2A [Labeo rohita]